MAQTHLVVQKLAEAWPDLKVEVKTITTSGDETESIKDLRSLGKGVFVKEIETALLRKRIDLAVHSLKDMPTTLPKGLKIGAVLEREEPGDLFIGRGGLPIEKLSPRSKIGTSSLRRRAFIKSHFPQLSVEELRGNLDTRLAKLMDASNGLAGIVVAAAGIRRLYAGKLKQFMQPIPLDILPPAPCQGIVALETREGDKRLDELMAPIDHATTHLCGMAERSILRRLQGGCNVPIAALAEIQGSLLKLTCWVSSLDGSRMLRDSTVGAPEDSEQISMALEVMLRSRGAGDIIEEIRMHVPWARDEEPVDAKPRSKKSRKRAAQ